MNSGARRGLEVTASYVTLVVLLIYNVKSDKSVVGDRVKKISTYLQTLLTGATIHFKSVNLHHLRNIIQLNASLIGYKEENKHLNVVMVCTPRMP